MSVSSFNVMKKSEAASATLFMACAQGDHFKTAEVVLRKAGGKDNKQSTFLTYKFQEVYVDSIQWSGSGGGDDAPTESLSFSFGKVEIEYSKQDTTGKMAKAGQAIWDLRAVAAK